MDNKQMDNKQSDITELTSDERQAVDAEIIRAKRASRQQPDIFDELRKPGEPLPDYLLRRNWTIEPYVNGVWYSKDGKLRTHFEDEAETIQALEDQPRIVAAYEQLKRWKDLYLAAPEGVRETIIERYTGSESLQPILQAWKDKVKELESQLAGARAGWIPVSERLPERNGYVLISGNDPELESVGEAFFWSDKKRFEDHGHFYYDVTHWRPLPAPPATDTK